MAMETDVTVIGLGNMGAALAQAFLDHGQSVTVWNRTAARAAPLVEAGAKSAKSAKSAAAAVAASPVIVVCLLDYVVASSVFSDADTAAAFRGRTLVQLATGNAKEARDQATWAQAHGVDYLDGGIMGFPADIGKTDTEILYAGSAAAFRTHGPTLRSLAGAHRYVGDDPGMANTVYLALWVFYYGAHGAFMEGAALAASVGMPILEYLALTSPMLVKLNEGNREAAQRLVENNLDDTKVSVDLMVAGIESVTDAFKGAGVPQEVISAYFTHLIRARDAGFGAKDIACIFDMLAPAARPGRG